MAAAWRFSTVFSRESAGFLETFGAKSAFPILGINSGVKTNDSNQRFTAKCSRNFHCNSLYFLPVKAKTKTKKSTKKEVKLMKKPVDDVYLEELYEPKQYEILEAAATLKRYTELDFSNPDSLVNLNMQLHPAPMKRGRVQQLFTVTELPNKFEYQNKICVFTEDADVIKQALNEGASRAGSDDVLQEINYGKARFDAYVCTFEFHKSRLLGNQEITKALGKLMPKKKSGITRDVIETLKRFRNQTIITNLRKAENESSVIVGRINQSAEEISENVNRVMELIRKNQNRKHPPIIKSAQLNCCADHLDLLIGEVSDLD